MTTGQRRNFQRCTWCGCIAAFLSSSSFWDFFLLHLGLSHNCNSISELDFFLDSFLDLFQYLFHIYIPPLRLYAFHSSSVWDFFLPLWGPNWTDFARRGGAFIRRKKESARLLNNSAGVRNTYWVHNAHNYALVPYPTLSTCLCGRVRSTVLPTLPKIYTSWQAFLCSHSDEDGIFMKGSS